MEIEPRPSVVVAKKAWDMVRIFYLMIKAGLSKSKIMGDFNLMMLKQGKLAGKAITNLMFHQHSSFSCRSNDAHLSFISPKEYEFSCSNSPAYPFYTYKRKHHHHHHRHQHHHRYNYDDAATVQAVQKVLEMLNNNNTNETVEASPLTTLPGFGKSPMVRQLRITDSPFPLKDDGDGQVDKAAEEFIKKFYKDLKKQKGMTALDSPYYQYSRGR